MQHADRLRRNMTVNHAQLQLRNSEPMKVAAMSR